MAKSVNEKIQNENITFTQADKANTVIKTLF